jgi:hypothetical protein
LLVVGILGLFPSNWMGSYTIMACNIGGSCRGERKIMSKVIIMIVGAIIAVVGILAIFPMIVLSL